MHHHCLNVMKLKLEQFDLLFYNNIIAIHNAQGYFRFWKDGKTTNLDSQQKWQFND